MRKFKSIFLVCCITVFFWMLLEASVRIALYIKTGQPLFLKHGFAEKVPLNTESYELFYDVDGNILYHKSKPFDDPINPVNSLGFRGPEISEKRSGTIRIICFGGSTTYGLSLPYAETYPKILQDRLDLTAGKNRYEVINAGVPAFKLHHIKELYTHEIVHMQPDIIVLMSVFNNLVTDGRDFSFIRVEGDSDNRLVNMSLRVVKKCSTYSLLVDTVDAVVQKGYRNMLRNVHWQQGAEAILRSTGLWNQVSADLHRFFFLITESNPGVQIIVLDEPMNIIDYPELAAPMQKAYQVQRDVCVSYDNVHHVDLMNTFIMAQKNEQKIWLAPYFDPIHLSREGNALIASVVAETIFRLY